VGISGKPEVLLDGEVWRLRAVADVLEQVYVAGNVPVGETNSGLDALLERLRFVASMDW
jgi:hypothetical protein